MGKIKGLDDAYEEGMATIYNARGTYYFGNGDYASALKDYEKAVELDNGPAIYHLTLGVALWKLGDRERAISECTRAIELEPTNDEYKKLLDQIESDDRS
jgi:tetratricopeptide (TPR) repeat protein